MEKKEKEKKKLKINKSKLLRNLVIACAVVLFTNFLINKNIYEEMNIQNRVKSMNPISVTMADALHVKTYSIDNYISYIIDGKFEKAYDMLTDEYKAYKSYNDFLLDLEGIDFNTFKLKEIKQVSENTYLAPVEYERNGTLEEEEYIVLVNKLNTKLMKISLNKFLYAFDEKYNFSKDGAKYTIESGVVHIDNIYLKVKVKNTNLIENLKITDLGVGFNQYESKTQKIEDGVIEPGKEKTYQIELEANYYTPKYLKVNRNIEKETIRTYLFGLEKD